MSQALRCSSPFAVLLIVLAAQACAPSPDRPGPAAQPLPRPASSADIPDARWGRFPSRRFDLVVALPDGKSWRIDDHSSRWLVASHAASGSHLWARTWREPTLANRARCEARAREWAPKLPALERAQLIDRRIVPAVPAPGFDTEIVAGIEPPQASPQGERVQGFVTAFGAEGKKCVAIVFTTSLQGASAAARLGDRLALGTSIVEAVAFRSELEPDVHAPAPAAR
jgi:hypothetical protein